MKKILLISTLLAAMAFAGCSKAPGSKDTGFHGMAWGTDVATVAKTLGVAPNAVADDSLFAGYYKTTAPRLGTLMEEGFANFLTGKPRANLDGVAALKGASVLTGKDGYSLFFNGKFGMNLRTIPASDFQTEHARLMKRYGVIDKKLDYIPNEYESSYFIQWHDADGVILLAKQVYQAAPDHEVTVAQLIHMDKRVFDGISGELSK